MKLEKVRRCVAYLNSIAEEAAIYLMRSRFFDKDKDVFTREFKVIGVHKKGIGIMIDITKLDCSTSKTLVVVPFKAFKL